MKLVTNGGSDDKGRLVMTGISRRRRLTLLLPVGVIAAGALVAVSPAAHADNKRLNASVFANIYTAQRQNGCATEPRLDDRLVDAARRHTFDVRDHDDVNGDIGSDGSTVRDRANDTGFPGRVVETIALNPALAING
ncbi:MAG: CAP domain-containing protein, partial [Solirubrobacterales bacterium]